MKKKNKKLTWYCAACTKNVAKTHYSITCNGKCNALYHRDCTGLSNDEFKAYENKQTGQKWVCNKCIEMNDESSNDDMEATGGFSGDVMAKQDLLMREVINFFSKKFNKLETLLSEEWKHIDEINSIVRDIVKENKQLREENDMLKNKVGKLEQDVTRVKNKVLRGEVQERNRNIVIIGLPKGDNVHGDVQKVLQTLDPAFQHENFEAKTFATAGAQNPILVTLRNTQIRDKILERRKIIRSLDTTTCGFTGIRRVIYLNEDMSKELKELFLRAKTLKHKGYKYVWCKYGKVFARKTDDSEVIRIVQPDQLSSLI